MKRSAIGVMVGTAFACAIVTEAARAVDAGSPGAAGRGQASARGEVAYGQVEVTYGQVKEVDRAQNTLTLDSGQQFTLEQGTSVTKDGQIATLSDITEGDDVWASFEPAPGVSTIRELNARTSSRQVMDGIPFTREQEFLHEIWTSGG